jgi:NAD(P)H-hydrate epimerase
VQPVVTPAEVKAIDDAALAREELDDILARVGDAICRAVIRRLGGTYGRRVNVLIGPGLNGADAASAARRLEQRGIRVRRVVLGELPDVLPPADLTLDGLFGIGLRRPFDAPDPGGTPVVAIDLPSGLDATTGVANGRPFVADHTLALMALKPGLLLGAGPAHAGSIEVLDIDLEPVGATIHHVDDGSVAGWLPARAVDAHKWNHALLVVAGSPGMTGAAHLTCRGAMRMGAGYVHLDSAARSDPNVPTEVVASLAGSGVRADHSRFAAAVVGPGLSRSIGAVELVRTVLGAVEAPVVLDGDGISAVAGALDVVRDRSHPTVLTPHDGEFERLTGERPGADRIAAARQLADDLRATILLKGPTTIVAGADGSVLLCTSGDARLATAGTGDVLAGMVGALLAQGVEPLEAAASAAHLHGRAAGLGPASGLVAGDLPDLVPAAVATL